MHYHLQGQGQNRGPFPLEELRRRRAAGELTGAERVWCAGMPDWQPLDSVLQHRAPDLDRHGPPPLPPGARRANRLTLWVVLGAAILLAAGGTVVAILVIRFGDQLRADLSRLRPRRAVEVAAQPVLWTTNTVTETDLHARRKEFRVRQWLEGYRQRGQRDQPCDAEAEQFIETWIARNHGGSVGTNLPATEEWGDRLVAEPGCADPLVLTVAAVNTIEKHEKIRRLERALKGFESSRHRAYPRFHATLSLRNELSGQPSRVASLEASAVQRLSEAFADASLLPEDQAEIADLLVTGWGEEFFKRNAAAICPVAAAAGKDFEWVALMMEGEHHVIEAWKARGRGFADSVSDRGWRGFSTHLAAARIRFTKAWKLRPDLPLAASRMISVAMGDSDAGEMRLWFDRALVAQIDHPQAWAQMRWGLRPRWHGSLESMLALGVTAVNTRRFDTDVPRKLLDVLGDLESEEQTPPGQHVFGRSDIWPHVQRLYEGYLADPSQSTTRDGWRSAYAVVAYLAGKHDVARSQLEALNWNPRPRNLAGWGADLSLLPLEVAARTGMSGREITDAESLRQRGDVAEALRRYTELNAATNADERTQHFIRHRLASLDLEQRLRQKGWVDFLPRQANDPNWAVSLGTARRLPDGVLEVNAGPTGHLLFCRARVGPDFEVKGEFEMVQSTTADFQAGLVMGMPDSSSQDWYALRVTRNELEGDDLSLSRAWGQRQSHRPVTLDSAWNAFQFRFQEGKISASLNDQEVFKGLRPSTGLRVSRPEILLGLGAFNDMNDTVIRYRNVRVRRLPTHPLLPSEQ